MSTMLVLLSLPMLLVVKIRNFIWRILYPRSCRTESSSQDYDEDVTFDATAQMLRFSSLIYAFGPEEIQATQNGTLEVPLLSLLEKFHADNPEREEQDPEENGTAPAPAPTSEEEATMRRQNAIKGLRKVMTRLRSAEYQAANKYFSSGLVSHEHFQQTPEQHSLLAAQNPADKYDDDESSELFIRNIEVSSCPCCRALFVFISLLAASVPPLSSKIS